MAALEHIEGEAFVVRGTGDVCFMNEAGRCRMQGDAAGTCAFLRAAVLDGGGAHLRVTKVIDHEQDAIWLVAVRTNLQELVTVRVREVAQRAGLTASQGRVLAALASGLTNRAIANSLQVSPRTVESHMVAIFDKLGVSTRAAVLATLLDMQ